MAASLTSYARKAISVPAAAWLDSGELSGQQIPGASGGPDRCGRIPDSLALVSQPAFPGCEEYPARICARGEKKERVVCVITGNGLKDAGAITERTRPPVPTGG